LRDQDGMVEYFGRVWKSSGRVWGLIEE
jgi:hypothetical protein